MNRLVRHIYIYVASREYEAKDLNIAEYDNSEIMFRYKTPEYLNLQNYINKISHDK